MEKIRSLIYSEAKEDDLAEAFQQELSKQLPGLDRNLASGIARNSAANLVVGLTYARKEAIRKLTERAVRDDWPADVLAERIRSQIGLDVRGVFAVENFRASLVAKGIPRGIARTQANAYAKRLRVSRAGTIARTELVRAVAVAKRAQWDDWRDNGMIDRHARRVFHTHKDEKRCQVCKSMNNKRAVVGQPYANGSLGPPLHPNCRCEETLERAGTVLMKSARDGDGDGLVDDGLPTERPAPRPAHDYDDIGATWRDNDKTNKARADFDALSDLDYVVVYHGTTPENAQSIMESKQIRTQDSRSGREFYHTMAKDSMYIAPTAVDAYKYGDAVIRFIVRKGDMQPSPEATTLNPSLARAFFNSFEGAVLPPGYPLTKLTLLSDVASRYGQPVS